MTAVLDLQTRVLVFVDEGKDAGPIDPLFSQLKTFRAYSESVPRHVSGTRIRGVAKHIRDVVFALDRFHSVKLYNDKLTTLRRGPYQGATGLFKKRGFKATRWLFWKNPENIDDR